MLLCVNPVIEKYEKHYIYGCNQDEIEMFMILLNKGVHIDGFISEDEKGITIFNKPVLDISDVEGENALLLVTGGYEGIEATLPVCNEVLVLNQDAAAENIYIYGAGMIGRWVQKFLTKLGISIQGFIDQRAELDESLFQIDGIAVYSPDRLCELPDDSTLLIAGKQFADMVICAIEKYQYKGNYEIVYELWESRNNFLIEDSGEKWIRLNLMGDIYNICYYISHNADKQIVLYGTDSCARGIAKLFEQLDHKIKFYIDDIIKEPVLDGYEVKDVEDLLYEQDYMVLVEHADARAACQKLENLGLSYAMDYVIARPFRMDRYFCRLNILDTNLGYTYLGKSQMPGFTTFGRNAENDYKVVILGGSTTDAELFPYASWPEILYKKIREKTKNVTVHVGAVAGYESAQELVKLIRDVITIQPNLVLIFDGFNDTRGKNTAPYTHNYQKQLFSILEEHYTNVDFVDRDKNLPEEKVSYGVKYEGDAVELWLRNIRMMHAICREFDISFQAFLQPMLGSKKQLDEDEKGIWKMSSIFYENWKKDMPLKFREWAKEHAHEYEYICDLSGIFDDISDVYMDDVHATQKGNEQIAECIYHRMKKYMER